MGATAMSRSSLKGWSNNGCFKIGKCWWSTSITQKRMKRLLMRFYPCCQLGQKRQRLTSLLRSCGHTTIAVAWWIFKAILSKMSVIMGSICADCSKCISIFYWFKAFYWYWFWLVLAYFGGCSIEKSVASRNMLSAVEYWPRLSKITCRYMVIHHTDCLHKRIANRRAHKFKPVFFKHFWHLLWILRVAGDISKGFWVVILW